MSYEINVPQIISYEYDFAVDGGAVSTIDLRAHAVNKLRAGLVVTRAVLTVETVLTSGGSATAVVGTSVDPDGFFLTMKDAAVGSYDGDSSKGGALLDVTVMPYVVSSTAATALPQLVIGTAALTAGKFKVDFHCYQAAGNSSTTTI